MYPYEDDISAEEQAEKTGSWLSEKNENFGRKKSTGRQKIKRKKEIISIAIRTQGHSFCGLSSFYRLFVGKCINERGYVHEIFRFIKKEQGFPERLSEREILCKPLFGYVRAGEWDRV